MSRHCSSVKSVGYDLSFIAPLPQNLTPTRRVNNSPDQMSRYNNCLKFSKPCNGHALRAFLYQQAADPFRRLNGRRCLTVIELLSQGHYLPVTKYGLYQRFDFLCDAAE